MQPTAEQFTEKAWSAIMSAQQLAQNRRHQHLESEHLLRALLDQEGLAGRILDKAGVSPPALQTAVDTYSVSNHPSPMPPTQSF